MITRKNIIDLLSTSSKATPYHSAVLTCYTFDPVFFESFYLPCLRALGITNVVVLMDASRYDALLANSAYACHPVRLTNYTLVRQENHHEGVFHPKIALLFGAKEGVLTVGSGNLTFSGMSENEEVWNAFHVKGNLSPHYTLFFQAWEYVKNVVDKRSPLVLRQLDRMENYTPWLREKPQEECARLASGETCWLLYNDASNAIIDQLAAHIGTKPVKSITVVAPFYDPAGAALRTLQSRFHPQQVHCVIDLDRQSAPFDLLHPTEEWVFYRYTGEQPLHAKLIQLQTEQETWLVSGSANAGSKALGMIKGAYHDEVCILLHAHTTRNYLEEMGVRFSILSESECNHIIAPEPKALNETAYAVRILSVEDLDGQLRIAFSKAGVTALLSFFDHHGQLLCAQSVTTQSELLLDLDSADYDLAQWVVLKAQEEEVSNRCLILKEVCVERANPDPNRRKLERLFDESALRDNLSHLLDLIAFDDKPAQTASTRPLSLSDGNSSSAESSDTVVEKARFHVLKESKSSIGLHTSMRILDFLKQVLFHSEVQKSTEDKLLEMEENEQDGDANTVDLLTDEVSDAAKMETATLSFLKRMEAFLLQLTTVAANHGDAHRLVREPKLVIEPRLNASSSINVAAITVLVLMNKHGEQLSKRRFVRDHLLQCGLLFYAAYTNNIPQDDCYESQKIRELLMQGSINLLTAYSFFNFSLNPTALIQAVLNALVVWKDQPEQASILPLLEKQLALMASPLQHPQSIRLILSAARHLMSPQPIPLQRFSTLSPTLFQYRKGYGFFVVNRLKRVESEWSYHYQYAWFEDDICYKAETYKGFPASVFME